MEVPRKLPLLILDLDETLVWASIYKPRTPHDFRVFDYYVTKRPYLEDFLTSAISWFDIAVWTSSGKDYAAAIVTEIFDKPSDLRFVWSSSRCTQRNDPIRAEYYLLKDLKKVKRLGFRLERVLMIDDSPEKLRRHYGNHLYLRPFEGDPEDRELLDVLPFLDWIRSRGDFRKIEKRSWRKRRLV